MRVKRLLRALAVGLTLVMLAACKSQPTTHILLIGNSFIAINDGIEKPLRELAPSANIAQIAVAGFTLEQHWNQGTALQTIRQGGWNYVVLQEQSQTPIFNRQKFFEYANKFNSEILKNHATTVLLMTWERPDSVPSGVTTTNLANVFNSVGLQLGAKVAPAGLAFARSRREKPELALYVQDGHPTVYGTFLAACVLYTTLYKQKPTASAGGILSMPPDVREYFQRIAGETTGF